MYTILITDSNELVTTVKNRIMQRSKLVDSLRFLVSPEYNGLDMSTYSVTMEYVLPISREYKTETLIKSDALYKDMLEYKLPIDTNITKEHGKVEIQLTFTKSEMDADGNIITRVRKTSKCSITIIPITAWSDYIVDSDLTALDQRLIQLELMANQINDLTQYAFENKADNIIYNDEENILQLSANGNPIGDQVKIVNGNAEGCTIDTVVVNKDGNLIVSLADGRVIDAGHVVGANGESGAPGVTFIPHIDDEFILTWTNDGGLINPDPVDLYPYDEWSKIDESTTTQSNDYIWEPI